MKKLLLLFFITLLHNTVFAQLNVNFNNNEATLIYNDGCDIATMKPNIKDWILKSFSSYKEVMDYEDSTKIIISAGVALERNPARNFTNAVMMSETDEYLTFKLAIDLKPNRYRLTFSNIEFHRDIKSNILGDLSYERETSPLSDECIEDLDVTYKDLEIVETNLNEIDSLLNSPALKKKEQKELLKLKSQYEKKSESLKSAIDTTIKERAYNRKRVEKSLSALCLSLSACICNKDDW